MRRNNYLNLILQMTFTEFKLKYAGSVLGYFWSLVKPLLLFAVLYLVFTLVFKLGRNVPNYPVYLLTGIVSWTFFVEATLNGMNSIVDRGDLIRKINFPKITIVLSASFTSLLTFSLNFLIVFVFLFLSKISPSPSIILLPILTLELLLLILGTSLILATLYTKLRDFSHIWELALQVLFYATPILYPIDLVPERFRIVVMLNPLAQIIQDMRWTVISHEVVTSWQILKLPLGLVPVIIVGLVFFLGLLFFNYSAKNFAEDV